MPDAAPTPGSEHLLLAVSTSIKESPVPGLADSDDPSAEFIEGRFVVNQLWKPTDVEKRIPPHTVP
jgi:hypothetical protein